MFSKIYKIYGANGHRISESFNHSRSFDFSEYIPRMNQICILNADITRQHKFIYAIVSCDTENECDHTIWSQLSDGIFENLKFGDVLEVNSIKEFIKILKMLQRNIDKLVDYIE